ncbi:MAG: hypothetical protein RSD74_08850, partial [Angelakisella sp.]
FQIVISVLLCAIMHHSKCQKNEGRGKLSTTAVYLGGNKSVQKQVMVHSSWLKNESRTML